MPDYNLRSSRAHLEWPISQSVQALERGRDQCGCLLTAMLKLVLQHKCSSIDKMLCPYSSQSERLYAKLRLLSSLTLSIPYVRFPRNVRQLNVAYMLVLSLIRLPSSHTAGHCRNECDPYDPSDAQAWNPQQGIRLFPRGHWFRAPRWHVCVIINWRACVIR